VPDAEPQKQIAAPTFAAFEQLVLPVMSMAPEFVPPVPRLPDDQVVHSTSTSTRLSAKKERALDVNATVDAFAQIDRVLDAVHDVAVAVFQRWLDQLSGHASPLKEHNTTLIKMVMDRVDRYGLSIYTCHHGEVYRVRLGVRSALAAVKTPEAIKAGFFSVTIAADPSGEAGKDAAKSRQKAPSFFPQLIVARTAQQAEAIWRARQGDEDILDAPD
jgi:hypothetical protein